MVGETEPAIGFQVYDPIPPVALTIVLLPIQIAGFVEIAVIVGKVLT